jgi:hypothetical protein
MSLVMTFLKKLNFFVKFPWKFKIVQKMSLILTETSTFADFDAKILEMFGFYPPYQKKIGVGKLENSHDQILFFWPGCRSRIVGGSSGLTVKKNSSSFFWAFRTIDMGVTPKQF